MRRPYWNCEIFKNWDGTVREDMLSHNIVCYGKPNSGKTEKVAKPFMRHAIERGASILLVQNNENTDYSDITEMAKQAGYSLCDFSAEYYTDASNEDINLYGRQLMQVLMKKRCMVVTRPDKSHRYEYSSFTSAFYELLAMEREAEVDLRDLAVVIEDADWEFSIPLSMADTRCVNFCITADCQRFRTADVVRNYTAMAYKRRDRQIQLFDKSNLRSRLATIAGNADILSAKEVLDKQIAISPYGRKSQQLCWVDNLQHETDIFRNMSNEAFEEYAYSCIYRTMSEFFLSVDTVICTGLSGVVPDDIKAFLQEYVLHEGFSPIGGKYLITELCNPLKAAVPKSVFPKTVMVDRKMAAEDIYALGIRPGFCIIEQNGVVKMFALHNGSLRPMVFYKVAYAATWVEMYFEQMGWGWAEPVEVDMNMIRYLLPTTNDRGEQEELTISYISKEDVQLYMDQVVMVTMEVEEYLTHPELLAEVPELDLKRDAPNLSLQRIAAHARRNYRVVRKVASAELPVDETTQKEVASMIEEYRWRPYRKPVETAPCEPAEAAVDVLPKKNILFLGGHANMVKKLRQLFPDWDYLTDDELGSWTGGDCEVIFFWTAHCSHKVMQYVNARKKPETPYLYVTATNIDRLVSEMAQKYKARTSGVNQAALATV